MKDNHRRKTTILQIPHTFLPNIGGIEYYTYRLARDLTEDGFDCSVISSSNKTNNTYFNNVKTFFLKSLYLLPRNPWIVGLSKLITDHNPKIVHIHSIWFLASFQVALMKKNHNYKIVNTIHGVRPDKYGLAIAVFLRLFSPIAKYIISKSDEIIVLSDTEKQKLTKLYPKISCHINVIGNGTDSIEPGKDMCRKIQKTISGSYILFTGRIIPDKNPDILIKALNKIWVNRDIKLVFLGPVTDIYRNYLLSVSNYPKRIVFYGALSPVSNSKEISAIYRTATINIAVGSWEGLPTRVLEAMAQSTPSIVYSSGGSKDIINDGINGYLIDSLDENLIVNKLKEYLSLDNKNKAQMEERAYESVKDKIWSKKYASILRLYETILNA